MIEAKEMVVETCSKIIEHFADKYKTSKSNIRIRIDLESINAKPVFGIFNESTVLERCSLKDIIRVSGGKGFSMILGMYIRNIIKDIFKQSLILLELNDSKQVFLLLYTHLSDHKEDPSIGLYKGTEFIWSLTIDEIMKESLEELNK